MLLLIDNYDSFTYNLVHRLGEIDATLEVQVIRNDKITVAEAESLQPSHLLLSPGPCTPKESGVCGDLIEHFRGRIPILGVCLGHQTMADRAGMIVERHSRLMHGKTSLIHHDGRGIFRNLPNPFTATRYHSLIVRKESVIENYEISAWTDEQEIMGLRWKGSEGQAPLDGVQFHPESFLTTDGPMILANFLKQAASGPAMLVDSHQR